VTEWLSDNVLWLIPAAPLAACLWIAVIGQVVRRQQAHRPVVLALAVSLAASLYLMSAIVPQTFGGHENASENHAEAAAGTLQTVYDWIRVGGLDVGITLRADAMSALMLVMVTSVSLLVAIFASGYMHGDPGYPRFFAEIALFVFSMCMLVLAGNFLLLFVFWEAVGLCSYLLIGFWFHKPSAAAAAKKAFVVNRIGDFGFILGVFLIWTTFGTLDFEHVLADGDLIQTVAARNPEALTAICLLLFVGAVGKSAQFPLHVWLPDAMEGPTPVSALIHAATMVTAGVYLVARCTPLFVQAPYAQLWVAGIGAATALIAAITALTQHDLKRVLAYSTVSQLGFMFMSLGAAAGNEAIAVNAVTFAMFHMFTHAYFKAVLFLSAGSVMHAMGDVIDMRRFGGLRKALPITHITFLAGALALAGFPLLSGFWSKDEILSVIKEAMLHGPHGAFFAIVFGVALLASLMTAFYTFRAYFLTFSDDEKLPPEAGHHPHDAPPAMAGPLYLLALAALGIGLVTGPTHFYAGYLHHTSGLPHGEEHHPDWLMMGVSTVIALAGIGAAYMIYGSGREMAARWRSNFAALAKWSYEGLYFDAFYDAFIVRPLRGLSQAAEFIDRLVIDKLVDACGLIPKLLGSILRPIQNGMVQHYAAMMLVGVLVAMLLVLRTLAYGM
jgi:NADH-quinone oxidoreductase subunit L